MFTMRSNDKVDNNPNRELSLLSLTETLSSIRRGYSSILDSYIDEFGLNSRLGWPLIIIRWHDDELRTDDLSNILGIEHQILSRSLSQLEHLELIEFRHQ